MATLGDTISRILTDLNREQSASARVQSAVVEAIEFYGSQRFGFNVARATTVTQTLGEYMELPDNYRQIDFIRVNDTNGRYLLEARPSSWIDQQGTDENNLSKPVAYATDSRELRLWPIPDGSYTLVMSYLKDLPEVSASAGAGATNAWLTEGFMVVYNHAMVDLLETYIGGEEAAAAAARHRVREAEAVRELARRANLEQGTGRIMGWI